MEIRIDPQIILDPLRAIPELSQELDQITESRLKAKTEVLIRKRERVRGRGEERRSAVEN